MYTPLTHYQMEYGKAGYDIMSNPMKYLDIHKEKEENSNFPLCLPSEILKRTTFKRCEDLKTNRIREERAERERKLENIMEKLDRCTNHVKNENAIICPCQFIV